MRQRQHLQREARGLGHVPAPVGLGVVTRMGVFDRDRRDALAGGARRYLELHGFARVRELAVEREAAAVGGVHVARARALVGVGHRAAARQAPGAGQGDGAVDAARTGRGGDHDAAGVGIEVIGQLHHHPVWLLAAGERHQRVVLAAGHRRQRAVELAVTAARSQVGDAAPVGPDRAPAQFGRRRRGRIREGRRRRVSQPRCAQSRRQQVVAVAVGAQVDARIEVHRRRAATGAGAGGQGQREAGQRKRAKQAEAFHGQTLTRGSRAGIVPWYDAPPRARC